MDIYIIRKKLSCFWFTLNGYCWRRWCFFWCSRFRSVFGRIGRTFGSRRSLIDKDNYYRCQNTIPNWMQILLTYMIYTTFAYNHFAVCHYRLTTKLLASSSKFIQPIGRKKDRVVIITAILFILFFALNAVVSVWIINAV